MVDKNKKDLSLSKILFSCLVTFFALFVFYVLVSFLLLKISHFENYYFIVRLLAILWLPVIPHLCFRKSQNGILYSSIALAICLLILFVLGLLFSDDSYRVLGILAQSVAAFLLLFLYAHVLPRIFHSNKKAKFRFRK